MQPFTSSGEEIGLTCRGLRIAARAWGPSDGTPVLALHGWLDNANSFAPLAAAMSTCRIVAPDVAGHGLSEHRSKDSEYHFVDWVTDVVEIADALQWPRFTLVGHSMGAGVGCLAAGTLQDRVANLVCLDGLGPLSSPPSEAPQRLAAHLREQRRLTARRQPRYASRAAMASILARVVPLLSLNSATLLLERGARSVDGGYTWSADPRLRGTSVLRLAEDHILAFLREISCRALFIRATDGYPMEDGLVAGRRAAIRGLQYAQVQGGHHVHMENPALVARLIDEFLS